MYSILLTLIIILNIISAQRDTRTAFQATSRRRMLCSIVEAASNAAFPDCSTNLYGKNITNLTEGASPKGFFPEKWSKNKPIQVLMVLSGPCRAKRQRCVSVIVHHETPETPKGSGICIFFHLSGPVHSNTAQCRRGAGHSWPSAPFFRKKLYFCPNSGKSG